MTIERAQAWWESVSIDLKLRRGQSGLRLLEMVGDVGYSPYKLRRAVEKIMPRLRCWISEGNAPKWAEKLYRECRRHYDVLELVPPLGDEIEV